MLDTRTRYFPAILEKLKMQTVSKETKRIKMMIHSIARKIDVFEVEIKHLSGSLQFKSEVSKLSRETLLSVSNPNYEALLKQNLGNIMNDMDKNTELPVHLIFDASDYTKMKVQQIPRARQYGELVQELTCFGWIFISPGKKQK